MVEGPYLIWTDPCGGRARCVVVVCVRALEVIFWVGGGDHSLSSPYTKYIFGMGTLSWDFEADGRAAEAEPVCEVETKRKREGREEE